MKYRSPYLIQRIEAATHSTPIPAGLAEKYARGEKRDEQERQWINGLMPLDYMGSAEFEWGAFGEAMKVMTAGKSSLVQFSLEIAGRPDSRDIVTKLSTVTVYCIAFAEHVEQVKRDVAVFAAKRYPDAIRTKEWVEMNEGLFGEVRTSYFDSKCRRMPKPTITLEKSKIVAWFNLDNGWWVGRDKSQVERIGQLIGVESDVVVA